MNQYTIWVPNDMTAQHIIDALEQYRQERRMTCLAATIGQGRHVNGLPNGYIYFDETERPT